MPGQVLAYDYHGGHRLPGAPVLRAAAPEDPGLLDALTAPGRVNARLPEEAITANLASILRAHGHVEAEIATVIGARAVAMAQAESTGADAVIDPRGLDARFGDYAHLLAMVRPKKPVLEEV